MCQQRLNDINLSLWAVGEMNEILPINARTKSQKCECEAVKPIRNKINI